MLSKNTLDLQRERVGDGGKGGEGGGGGQHFRKTEGSGRHLPALASIYILFTYLHKRRQ
jgi:hypothetical protein